MQEPEVIADVEHEQVVSRVASIDVAKASGMVCTRVPHPGVADRRITKVWQVSTTTNSILELADHLAGLEVERVVVESTSDYWRPFVYLLQAAGVPVWLVNAHDVKNVPGAAEIGPDAQQTCLARPGPHRPLRRASRRTGPDAPGQLRRPVRADRPSQRPHRRTHHSTPRGRRTHLHRSGQEPRGRRTAAGGHRPARRDPRDRPSRGADHHRRDRSRYDPFSDRRPSGVLGQAVPTDHPVRSPQPRR